ncbi:MAG TPA: ABC transporter permease subunit [Micromonospora sp.]
MNLVRSELLKIRTTNTWWIFALITLPLWAVTLFFNYLQTDALLQAAPTGQNITERAQAAAAPENIAANLYTNGQFFGVLIVMVLGVIVVTNEFFHQTATTTFLITPRRTPVIVAKLVAAAVAGVLFWLVTTVLNLLIGPVLMTSFDLDSQLASGAIWRVVALNGMAYLLWAVFGVGFGVLMRSQIGATITSIVFYFLGFIGGAIFLNTLADQFGQWINSLQVLIPSLASQLMVSATELPGSPPQWVGAAVMIGYGLVTSTIGTMIVRNRDIG